MNPESSDVSNLVTATQTLAVRVQTLADAVTINNGKIDHLQHEVNCKPDDVELQFVAKASKADRKRLRYTAIGTAIVSALLSGILSFYIADTRSDQRCVESQKLSDSIARFLLSIPDPSPTLQSFTDEIEKNRKPC